MIYKLVGSLQHYSWGGKNYLAKLLNFTPSKDQHYAEYWLGAHNSSPSIINVDEKTLPLNQFLSANPSLLGAESLAHFADELPFLLKILDVEKPLSIQIHPTKQQAEIGFEFENQQGIALSSTQRSYKDRNHKPEMMIALSDFWLLHGFKTKDKILATLTQRPSLALLASKLENQDLSHFYSAIMQATQEELSQWLTPIIEQNKANYLSGKLKLDNPDYWLLYTMEAMSIPLEKLDVGLICFYLFNIVHLQTGEGIYQAAGIPHAYLRGQNIELMACSDNVIRGGLTTKYVDIAELLKIIDCSEIEPQIIPVAPQQPVFSYQTPAKDFALENVAYQQGDNIQHQVQSAAILLVMQGEVKIFQNNTALSLKQGEAVFIGAETAFSLQAINTGYSVLAKLPD